MQKKKKQNTSMLLHVSSPICRLLFTFVSMSYQMSRQEKAIPQGSSIPLRTMWKSLSNLLLQECVIWQQSPAWAPLVQLLQIQLSEQSRKVVMHTSCVYVVGCVSLSPSIISNNTQSRVLSKISYVIAIQTVTRKLNCIFYILTISISTAIANFLQE